MTGFSFPCGLVLIACVAFGVVPLPAHDFAFKNDGTQGTLVELYSSEGCSSCPPAEAWVSSLKNSPRLWKDLFPVAFHVDYWDGLGWPDRFARPAYTQRQRNYAARLGQDSVYTPEFVANGREWRGWFDGHPLPSMPGGTGGALMLSGKDDGRAVSASYSPVSGAPGTPYLLNVALLGVNIRSDVQRGENSGRQLQHDFVVLDFKSKPMASAKAGTFESGPLDLASTDVPGAIVAWISTADGAIAQIAGGSLKSEPALGMNR